MSTSYDDTEGFQSLKGIVIHLAQTGKFSAVTGEKNYEYRKEEPVIYLHRAGLQVRRLNRQLERLG